MVKNDDAYALKMHLQSYDVLEAYIRNLQHVYSTVRMINLNGVYGFCDDSDCQLDEETCKLIRESVVNVPIQPDVESCDDSKYDMMYH